MLMAVSIVPDFAALSYATWPMFRVKLPRQSDKPPLRNYSYTSASPTPRRSTVHGSPGRES